MTMEISVKEKLKLRGADGDGAVKTKSNAYNIIRINTVTTVQPILIKSVSGF